MRNLSNEDELELLADLIEPAAEILGDGAVSNAFKSGDTLHAIKYAIKNHKKAVIEIMARVDGVPVEEYKISALTLPVKVIALLNKPEVKELFTVQDQTNGVGASGPAMENTEDGVK